LKRKNKKRFFSFQSMPNLNFAELIVSLKKANNHFGKNIFDGYIYLVRPVFVSVFFCLR